MSREGRDLDSVEINFSPTFKSLAAMAGWDEEAILVASLIVEDTPERKPKTKRMRVQSRTPPTITRRSSGRRQSRSPLAVSIPILNLDEENTNVQENQNIVDPRKSPEIISKRSLNQMSITVLEDERITKVEELATEENIAVAEEKKSMEEVSKPAGLPCMDRLREELSCAICLEICYEPSTTTCGHSFCRKCLRHSADKCGKKCPKCRQLISNGRSCTVNTVLWNTIQLLFPEEVESKKKAYATRDRSSTLLNDESSDNFIRQNLVQPSEAADYSNSNGDGNSGGRRRRRRGIVSQSEDAALALRLQREEFLGTFRETQEHSTMTVNSARANLRAMAARAAHRRRNQFW